MTEATWPNAFIVGAHRGGTTSLFSYLGQHPDVFTPTVKEPNYFVRRLLDRDDPGRVEELTDRYLELFEDADAPVRLEASVPYLRYPEVAELIAEEVPEARIVASLRDPVERAYSNYWLRRAGGVEDRPFLEALEAELDEIDREGDDPARHLEAPSYIRYGRYARPVERYLDVFGDDRVEIVLFYDLVSETRDVLRGLARFLDLDPGPVDDVDLEARNTFRGVPRNAVTEWLRTNDTVRAVARRVLPESARDTLGNRVLLKEGDKPPIDPDARRLLEDVFEPEIRELESVLGRDLPELRASWGD